MLKKIFWSGLKVFIPLVVTFALVFWILKSIEAFFGYFLHILIPRYYFPGLGIIVGFTLILLLGALVNAWMIGNLYQMYDRLMKRIPLIKSIYNAIQQLVDFFDKDKQTQGQQAVMIETDLGKMIGFITRESITELPFAGQSQDEVLVYVPLSYQLGGVMLAIKREKLTLLDWPIDAAMSFVLTAGMAQH